MDKFVDTFEKLTEEQIAITIENIKKQLNYRLVAGKFSVWICEAGEQQILVRKYEKSDELKFGFHSSFSVGN